MTHEDKKLFTIFYQFTSFLSLPVSGSIIISCMCIIFMKATPRQILQTRSSNDLIFSKRITPVVIFRCPTLFSFNLSDSRSGCPSCFSSSNSWKIGISIKLTKFRDVLSKSHRIYLPTDYSAAKYLLSSRRGAVLQTLLDFSWGRPRSCLYSEFHLPNSPDAIPREVFLWLLAPVEFLCIPRML